MIVDQFSADCRCLLPKVYGGERVVAPTDLVPWHVMELIQLALGKAKAELAGGEERMAAAEERLSAARETARNSSYCPW